MPKIVIDGNIGAGKTTQLSLLEDRGYCVRKEPLDQWPLELFYSDPERWGLMFQMIILKTLKAQDNRCVYERCPQTSRDVFWKLMKKNPEEDRTYHMYYETEGWSPDVYIYISTPPELCQERMKSRSQDGDSSVSLQYLQDLHMEYLAMYAGLECPKYIIDGTLTEDDILKTITDIVDKHYALCSS